MVIDELEWVVSLINLCYLKEIYKKKTLSGFNRSMGPASAVDLGLT